MDIVPVAAADAFMGIQTPSDLQVALHHRYRQSSPAEIPLEDQAIVATSDDHSVVFRSHLALRIHAPASVTQRLCA